MSKETVTITIVHDKESDEFSFSILMKEPPLKNLEEPTEAQAIAFYLVTKAKELLEGSEEGEGDEDGEENNT